MRKCLQPTALLFAALFLVGCDDFVSIHPLYDESTLTSDPSLAGTWTSTEGNIWTFAPSKGRKYQLTVTDSPRPSEKSEEEKWEFEAGLVELSGRLFLDLCGKDSGITGAPAHIFARIRIDKSSRDGNVLEVAWLVQSWMKKQIDTGTYLTSLPPAHGRTILTASTRDLQDFFRRHAWDEEAFSTELK